MTTLNSNTKTAAYFFAAPTAAQTAYLMTRTKSMYLALIVVLLSPMTANAGPLALDIEFEGEAITADRDSSMAWNRHCLSTS
jgi:hypothetical protein